jgi:acyl-CoA synthetase (NDP forming)
MDSWGAFVMRGLCSTNFPGKIYPINRGSDRVFNLPAYQDIRDIPEPVDLAVIAIPAEHVAAAIEACGQKGVRGVTVITAGFAETYAGGVQEQARLARLARSLGMVLLGPNVSGTFNLHAGFNTTPGEAHTIFKTSIAAISQGGFAFSDILTSGRHQRMGVGRFVHTGNEADLTVTDFLELFGQDDEIQAIVMYIEAIRDGRRFARVARQVSRRKPIVVYKAGRSTDSARAAQSHTGAISSGWMIYRGIFQQTGVVMAPAMELLLPLAHALVERPAINGNRIGIITMGGSWGVSLADSLAESGLSVAEFSAPLQNRIRTLGLTDRASAKNPLDFGASGRFVDTEFLLNLCKAILGSGEVDAMVLHGFGRAGQKASEGKDSDIFYDVQKEQALKIAALEKKYNRPVLVASHHSQWESQTVQELIQQGIRVYTRLSDIAVVLSGLHAYWRKKAAASLE